VVGYYTGRVSEIRLELNGQWEICVLCPGEAIPLPGQYLLASDSTNRNEILGTPLFICEETVRGFWANPLHPISWGPGTHLNLVGPFGHGFNLPRNIQRLGMVATGETISRLRPLINTVTKTQTSVTLFTDLTLSWLPEAVEVSPLATIKTALDWPDFLTVDVPLNQLGELRNLFGMGYEVQLPCPAQALITTPMPCAGMAKCGVCAVQTRRGWRLVCEDGPVFELSSLQW
jgi:Iron-sulfur cluster binding domain of dihydroorotate dehydrogenase B